MSNGSDLPDGFFGYAIASIGAAMSVLVTTIATLWKVSESKNAKAIEEQRQEIINQKVEYADARSQMKTEISMVRENLKAVEDARLECERDRAMLTAKCEIFESRLSKLEGHA
jgi:septal ring factor EnvC (AmiA/AmiB activator)